LFLIFFPIAGDGSLHKYHQGIIEHQRQAAKHWEVNTEN